MLEAAGAPGAETRAAKRARGAPTKQEVALGDLDAGLQLAASFMGTCQPGPRTALDDLMDMVRSQPRDARASLKRSSISVPCMPLTS